MDKFRISRAFNSYLAQNLMKAGKNRQIRYPDFYTLLVQIQKPIFRAHSRGVARLSSLR